MSMPFDAITNETSSAATAGAISRRSSIGWTSALSQETPDSISLTPLSKAFTRSRKRIADGRLRHRILLRNAREVCAARVVPRPFRHPCCSSGQASLTALRGPSRQ